MIAVLARLAKPLGLGFNALSALVLVGLCGGLIFFSLPPFAPIIALPLLVGAMAALAIVIMLALRAGLLLELWFAAIVTALLTFIPMTSFSFESVVGEAISTTILGVLTAGILILAVLFVLEGVRAGGLLLVAVALTALGYFGYRQVYLGVQSSYVTVHTEAAESAAEAIEYSQARQSLEERLKEVDAPINGQTIEERLDLSGLSRVEANAYRKDLELVRAYEQENGLTGAATFGGVDSGVENAESVAPSTVGGGGGSWRDNRERQERDEEAIDEEAEIEMVDQPTEDAEDSDDGPAMVELSPEEFTQAMRVADVSLYLTRWVTGLVIMMSVLHYLRQLNWTFPALNPLPFAGPLVDKLQDKERCIHLRGVDHEAVAYLVATAARKGESSLIFGGATGVPGPLPRWTLGPFAPPLLRKLEVKRDTHSDFFPDSGFIFESAWFGRYCFQLTDLELSQRVLLDLVEALRLRKLPKAASKRTLNLVWAHSEPLPERLLSDLLHLCRAVNARLILVSDDEPPAAIAEHLDATYGADAFG